MKLSVEWKLFNVNDDEKDTDLSLEISHWAYLDDVLKLKEDK